MLMTRSRVLFVGVVAAATMILPWAAPAQVDDAVVARRSALYRELAREIRCPASRNMSIAESTEPVAADRRRELRDLVDAGMDEAEIRHFVVRRYGEAALYSPRLRPGTLALWLSPILFGAASVLAWWRIVTRYARLPLPDE